MRYTSDIKIIIFFIDDIHKSVYGRYLLCFVDELNEELLRHYISIHEDIGLCGRAVVPVYGFDPFLSVKRDPPAVPEGSVRIVHLMIEQGYVRA